MLSELLIRVGLDALGQAEAAFFHEATGLDRSTFYRSGYRVVAGRADIPSRLDTYMVGKAIAHGAASEEAKAAVRARPEATTAAFVYWLGLLGNDASPWFRSVVDDLDAIDDRLARMMPLDRWPAGTYDLGDMSRLGIDYSEDLDVAGVDPWKPGVSKPPLEALKAIRTTFRAQMALSLLAAIDVECGAWSERRSGDDPWRGLSRFAMLLLDADHGAPKRRRPSDPIARLVDFVGAVGHSYRRGRWSLQRSTIDEMGDQANLSGVIEGDGRRYVGNLRKGETRLTGDALRELVASQLGGRLANQDDVAIHVGLLAPYHMATLLLTRLMPPRADAPRHLDRRGWRDAYLRWWRFHAEGRVLPEASRHRPPRWLVDQ